MKKILYLLAALILVFSLNGCAAKQTLKNNNSSVSHDENKSTSIKSNDKSAYSLPKTEVTALKYNDNGIPVIMYHSIKYEKDNAVRIPKEDFEAQMKYLKDNGYTTLSLDELYDFMEKNTPVPEKSVVLTFDDGYKDNYETAYPILKKYGFKATIFVIANYIGKDEYLTTSQIKELDKNGFDIESHTANHEDLSTLSYEKQLATLKSSKETLEKLLNKEVKYIAYPYGKHNENTVKAAKNAGYKLAFTTDGRWSDKSDGILTLDRVFISSSHNLDTFVYRITTPNYDFNKIVKSSPTVEDKYNEAYAAFFDHKYEEAIKISDEIIMENPSFFKAYNIKGISQCFSNNFEEGMKNIDKALNINPNYGYGRFNKALAYELYGHYDEALSWYDKALEVEKYVWSYYGKASIYGRRGDVANTVKYLKIAINMQESVKEEAKKEKDFDNVRNSKEFMELVK